MIKGRFNYVSLKKDLYNVIFVPDRGGGPYAVIAEDLDWEAMRDLTYDLNGALLTTKKELGVER